jgi:hypothetical protein
MITPSFGLTATERVLPKLALDFTTASLDSRVTFTRTGATATRTNSSGYIEAVAAVAGNPAPSIPLVPGAVEILRFPAGVYFSGGAAGASTVYMTPGEGL